MIGLAILLNPLFAAIIAAVLPSNHFAQRFRPFLLPCASATHLGLIFHALTLPSTPIFGGFLVIDPLAKVFLLSISVLYFACSLYAPPYLHLREERENRVFCVCLLFLLSMMSFVTMAHHLGLLWVMIEATTLSSAPLIYFNRTALSLEAAWKYLLICSVGIALALLGSFFLAYSSLHATGLHQGFVSTLLFEDLILQAPHLSKPWLRAAFVTLLVGYGTKMGLAPMHTWKPDAYGEAPGIVGAILAGGVTSCAFLALIRFLMIMHAASETQFAEHLFLGFGLFSMIIASVFLIRQRDYKRMLAYSSVEHMGILLVGLGVGGAAVFGSLFHLLNNALTKGILFMSSGNLHRAYGSKSTDDVQGTFRHLPLSSSLLLAGFIAITGSPPFGPFVSQFTIIQEMISKKYYFIASLFLVALFVVFIGMGSTILKLVFGTMPTGTIKSRYQDSAWTVVPAFLLLGAVFILGVYLPPPLRALLQEATLYIRGSL